jgi:hypothetical protein
MQTMSPSKLYSKCKVEYNGFGIMSIWLANPIIVTQWTTKNVFEALTYSNWFIELYLWAKVNTLGHVTK